MDYLFGSLVTLSTVILVIILLRHIAKKNVIVGTQYTQSYLYELIRPLLSEDFMEEQYESQGTKHYDSNHTEVLIMKDKAYWIKDNGLHTAPISDEGNIDKDNAIRVDTMSMNKVQLDEVMLIVEELTRGKGYDSRGSGK